jgi:acetolactate synthase I/II/III large subunit
MVRPPAAATEAANERSARVEQVTGGDIVAVALERLGVDVVFGIPSVHNLPIYDALRRRGAIRAITVRHEQSAAGAADGYARVSGRLGVVITSTGPGAANAMGALLEARVSASPVLHITGQIDSRFLGQGRGFIHEVPDQAAMLKSVCKWSAVALSTEEIPERLVQAAAAALRPASGPASIEIPIDLQYASCGASLSDLVPTDVGERARREVPPIDQDAVAAAAQVLEGSSRPLIWAGGGVVASGAESELEKLAHLLGAGVLTSPNGRGVMPEDDPLCIGNLPWDEDVRALCQDADVLLAVGTRFQGPNTQNWQMVLPDKIVHIDVDPSVPGRSYPVVAAVVADARGALSAILARLGAQDGGAHAGAELGWRERVAETALQARRRLRSTLGPQEGLLDELQDLLPAGTVVVKDSTIPAYTWGNRLLKVGGVRSAVMPNSFAIGLGVPHALGAAAADPSRPVVLMVGDGGFMLAAGDLATYAQERLPVVVLLFNDGGYGILRNIQDRQYGERIGVDLGKPDFCGLARALGVEAERVDSIDGYAKAVGAALARAAGGEPQLVEIDLDAIGPMSSPFIGTSRPPGSR